MYMYTWRRGSTNSRKLFSLVNKSTNHTQYSDIVTGEIQKFPSLTLRHFPSSLIPPKSEEFSRSSRYLLQYQREIKLESNGSFRIIGVVKSWSSVVSRHPIISRHFNALCTPMSDKSAIRLARIVTRDFPPTISIIFKRWLVPASPFCHFSSFADSGYPLSLVWIRKFRENPPSPPLVSSLEQRETFVRRDEANNSCKRKKREKKTREDRASIDDEDPSWRTRDISPSFLSRRQALSRFYAAKARVTGRNSANPRTESRRCRVWKSVPPERGGKLIINVDFKNRFNPLNANFNQNPDWRVSIRIGKLLVNYWATAFLLKR